MASVQSSNVPIELSFDGGSNWKVLVCLTDYTVPVDTPTNITETFCGTEVGLGSTTFNPTGTAVCKVLPEFNEVTFQQMLTTQLSELEILFRVRYPGTGSIGSTIYLSGSCYVTNTTLTLQTGQTITFGWTLTGTGTLDTTP